MPVRDRRKACTDAPQDAATVLLWAALQAGQGIDPVRSRRHDGPLVSAAGTAGALPRRRSLRWLALSGQDLACSASSGFARTRASASDARTLAADPPVARPRTDRMTPTAGRVPTLGPCCEASGSTECPIQSAGQRDRTSVAGSRRIRRMNQRSIAESASQGTHTMFRTPFPANYPTSSSTRCCRRLAGLYGLLIPSSLSRPLPSSTVFRNRVPSRVIECPFPKRRADPSQGAR